MISTSLAKIAKDILNPYELDELNRWATRLDATIAEASSASSFINSLLLGGAFKSLILAMTTPVAIANNTETAVSFDIIYMSGGAGSWDLSDPQKIFRAGNKCAFVMGTASWDMNGTGRRAAHINQYDAAGAFQWGHTMHSLLPSGVDDDTLPYFNFLLPTPAGHYYKTTVIQTSGGPLNLNYLLLAMFEP